MAGVAAIAGPSASAMSDDTRRQALAVPRRCDIASAPGPGRRPRRRRPLPPRRQRYRLAPASGPSSAAWPGPDHPDPPGHAITNVALPGSRSRVARALPGLATTWPPVATGAAQTMHRPRVGHRPSKAMRPSCHCLADVSCLVRDARTVSNAGFPAASPRLSGCPACGDNDGVNHAEVSPELQPVRGPYGSAEEGRAALQRYGASGAKSVMQRCLQPGLQAAMHHGAVRTPEGPDHDGPGPRTGFSR
jgi:hypothetical protein